jgi:hypothetical protein
MPDLNTISGSYRTIVDHGHRHQLTTRSCVRASVRTTTAPSDAQRHGAAVADVAAAWVVDGLIEGFSDQLPRRVVCILDGLCSADLFRAPPFC